MIRCWYFRRIISNCADVNVPLTPAAREHVGSCPHCREVYEREMEIVGGLCASANEQRKPASPFLHARIVSSLEKSRAPAGGRRIPGWVPLATAAVCVVLAAVTWQRSEEAPDGTVAAPSIEIAQPAAGMPSPETTPLSKWTTRLDEPLEREMKLVINDTRMAMNSLAENFLPPELRTSLFAQQSQN